MNNIPRQLGAILDFLGLELASLFDKGKPDAGENRNKVMVWLYRILDTLDSKTAQVRSFAALLLAAQTFLVGLVIGRKEIPHWISIPALLLLLFPLVGGLVGLSIFQVQWKFFGYVSESDQPGSDSQIQKELQELAELCDRRVAANQLAYKLCWLSSLAFALTLVLALIVVIWYPPCQ